MNLKQLYIFAKSELPSVMKSYSFGESKDSSGLYFVLAWNLPNQ